MENRKINIRVLHLFSNYLPPSQVWLHQLIKNIQGTEVHIAARHFQKQNFYHPRFHYIPNIFDGLNQYKMELSKRGGLGRVKLFIVRLLSCLSGSYDRKIIHYIRQHNIQILHAHFAPVAWSYRRVARKSKIPLVISFYGYDYEYFPKRNPIFNQHYQDLFALASLVLCEGDHGKRILQRKGCPTDKVRIAKLGIEIDKIQYRERTKGTEELRLIQVASFTGKKGHIYTLKAFLEALKICPNLSLTLIGNTRDEEVKIQVDRFILENDLSAKVQIRQFLPYQEVIYELYRHHVFIHPSCYTEHLDCEGGAPIVLLDAQATGMPVISTTHCDIPQEVRHQETGWLVPEKDVLALSKAIIHYYHMGKAELNQYGKRASQYVAEHYDVVRNAKVLDSFYSKLI